jgi:hypothetical protein
MMNQIFRVFIDLTRQSLLVSIYSILQLLLNHNTCLAQSNNVHAIATLDTNRIRIGEQVVLSFDVTAPKDAFLIFPQLPDTSQNIEVVERTLIDTLKTGDASMLKYHQKIVITCFDPGIYILQPFKFYYGLSAGSITDSVATDQLMLKVDTMMVDTSLAIKDIKLPFRVPLTWRDALPYIISVIALFAVIAYWIYLRRKRKRSLAELHPVITPKSAHEAALEALRKLQEQKLWQQGLYKEYHSQVSDTIRTYIEHRFYVMALELPSDDTLDRLIRAGISAEAFEKLRSIFQIADMVKFAKTIPLSTENEMSLQAAFEFVMITKHETRDEIDASKEQKEDEQ